jgi:hypothetical protein
MYFIIIYNYCILYIQEKFPNIKIVDIFRQFRRSKNWHTGANDFTSHPMALIRIARRYILNPKIPIWVYFGEPYNVGIFYGH